MPSFEDYCYGFDDFVLSRSFSAGSASDIEGIVLCSQALRAIDPRQLYIGTLDTASFALDLWDETDPLNLLIAECNHERDARRFEKPGVNLVVTCAPLADLYNMISGNISDLTRWEDQLSNVAVRDDSVGELLGKAVSIFDKQMSLYLLSPTFHLIDYRSFAISPESMFMNMEKGDSFTDSQISFLIESSKRGKGTEYITEPILEDGSLRGYLLIIHDTGVLIPKCFVDVLTRLIPVHIKKLIPTHVNRTQQLTDLLSDILLFNPNDVEPLYARLETLQYPLKPCVRMLIVTYDYNPKQQSITSEIEDLEAVFPECNIAPYDRYIVVLLSGEDFLFRPRYNQERLERLLEQHGSYAIFTASVRFIRGMRVFYRQATEILRLMERTDINGGKRSAFFDDLFEYARAHACISALKSSKESTKLVYLFHPFVAELLRYDDINGTDFTSFAFAFAENGGSIAQTADAANYHRNTVYNKVARIQELIGVEIGNSAILRELIFAKHVMEIANAEGYTDNKYIIYNESRFSE